MTIAPGTRLGPYEILGQIGAGGMGEVYRAKDTRLERTVAVKVLPPHLSSSPESRQRFEREAKTISQLSHPHICALYDVGREGETEYLVMELLEGDTLSDRLAKGPLPLEQTLRYGTEIADALDKAHRQGIVHRDLKPGNVMLTKSGVKLLDFGLAKAFERPLDAAGRGQAAAGQDQMAKSSLTALPTVAGSPNLTEEGTILGTFQYMAPEQLEGKEADVRTDIFAFGAVLYEMATGRKAFSGSSQASLISSIMTFEPPALATVEPMTPAALEHIVQRCLTKSPDDRWQSAGDVAGELRWLARVPSPGATAVPVRSRRGRAVVIAAFLLVAALLAVFALFRLRPGVSRPQAVRFLVAPPAGVLFTHDVVATNMALSPDGRHLAFVGSSQGRRQIWLRDLDVVSARPLPGTEGGSSPFWSPDSRSLGYFADRKLKRLAISGGAPQVITDAPSGGNGCWGPDDTILFIDNIGRDGILRVPASGGAVAEVTHLDKKRGDFWHAWPSFLPDGHHFLFSTWFGSDKGSIRLGSLEQGDLGEVLPVRSRAVCPRGLSPLREGERAARAAFRSERASSLRRASDCGRPDPVLRRDGRRRLRGLGVGGARVRGGRASGAIDLVRSRGPGSRHCRRFAESRGAVDFAGRAPGGRVRQGQQDGIERPLDRRPRRTAAAAIHLLTGRGIRSRLVARRAPNRLRAGSGQWLGAPSGQDRGRYRRRRGPARAHVLPDPARLVERRPRHRLQRRQSENAQRHRAPPDAWRSQAGPVSSDELRGVRRTDVAGRALDRLRLGRIGKVGGVRRVLPDRCEQAPRLRRGRIPAPLAQGWTRALLPGGRRAGHGGRGPGRRTGGPRGARSLFRSPTTVSNRSELAIWNDYDVSPDGQRFLIRVDIVSRDTMPVTVALGWAAGIGR